MFSLPTIQMQRTAWTLNDIVNGNLRATHICFVMQYGNTPTYGITNLETQKTVKFRGSIELIRKLYTRKVLVRVVLNMAMNSYQADILPEDRTKFVDNQVEGEIKLPNPVKQQAQQQQAAVPRV